MKTEIIQVHPAFPEREIIERCAKMIHQGGLIIFPTETVYGIAANADNAEAVKRLREVKRRREDKPFSIIVTQKDAPIAYGAGLNTKLFKLVDHFWPGPLTVILNDQATGKTVGLRMPQHPVALTLAQVAQCPLAAPSANVEGAKAPQTCEEALKDLDGLVDIALDGGPADYGEASTIVDFTHVDPVIIREGAIRQSDVDAVVNKKMVLMVCTGNSCRSVMAEYLLREKLKQRPDVKVTSAGTSVYVMAGASSGALSVLAERHIDATQHRSQPVTKVLAHKADLILVMSRRHRDVILQYAPELRERVRLLKEFCSDPSMPESDLDIIDPIGQPPEAYEACAQIIDQALEEVLKTL